MSDSPTKGNRRRGHSWEREIARKLREIHYEDARCSREVSRHRDNSKVDIANANEDDFGRLPYNIQCKATQTSLNYRKLLDELDVSNGREQINVVFHKTLAKSKTGKYMNQGEFAFLNLDDFLHMVKLIKKYEDFLLETGVELDLIFDELLNYKL